jgi:hypothetical protein
MLRWLRRLRATPSARVDRLRGVVDRRGDPAGAAWAQCRTLLRGVVLLNNAPSPELVSDTAQLAELAHRLDPTSPRVRYILAAARLWQGRVEEAGDLCRDADADAGEAGAEARATGLLVRALVDMWSTGGTDRTAPLLAEAVRAGCPPELAWLAGRLPWTLGADHRT